MALAALLRGKNNLQITFYTRRSIFNTMNIFKNAFYATSNKEKPPFSKIAYKRLAELLDVPVEKIEPKWVSKNFLGIIATCQ